MGVPHFLWSNALLTSTYLLNRLPSSPLGGEVPLRCLHPNHDLFLLPPLVFGCVAFVHDHTSNTSELAPCSVKGVFVSYSHTHKGYQVYFLDQCKYGVSVDVTFFESTRHFSSTSSSTPPPTPSPSPIPTKSSSSSQADTSNLPTLMDPAPFLSLSPPSSPMLLLDYIASPLLMLPMTSPVLISTPVYTFSPADSSTSSSYLMPISLPLDDLHLP